MNNWEKMSALADDQLVAEEASALQMAMQADPNLRSQYESILSLKRSLRNDLPTHNSPQTLSSCLDRIRELDRVGKTENIVHKFRYAIVSVLALAVISAATINQITNDGVFDTSAISQTLSAGIAGGGNEAVRHPGQAAAWLAENLSNFNGDGLNLSTTDELEIQGKRIGRYFYRDSNHRLVLLVIPGVVDCNGDPVPGYNGLTHTTIDGVNALVWTEDSRSFVFAGDVSVPQLLSYLR